MRSTESKLGVEIIDKRYDVFHDEPAFIGYQENWQCVYGKDPVRNLSSAAMKIVDSFDGDGLSMSYGRFFFIRPDSHCSILRALVGRVASSSP